MNRIKSILRKIAFVCCMVFCFVTSYNATANAATVTFNNWYSNAYWVGYWATNPQVFFTNLSTSMDVSVPVSNAVTTWSNAGISSSVTTTPSYGKIRFYGGTRTQLSLYGFSYSSTTLGLTTWDSYTTAATANSHYSIKKLTSASASYCSEADSSYYYHLALHEYGHALGWYGHTGTSGDVMYEYENTVTTLTSRDKNQLKQVYNAMR